MNDLAETGSHQAGRSTAAEVLRSFWPRACEDLHRFGRATDGGYLLSLRAVRSVDAVLSLGLADDWSFEEALLRTRPELMLHAYDPTVGLAHFRRAALLWCFAPGKFRRRRAVWRRYAAFFNESDRRHFRERIGRSPGCTDLHQALQRIGDARNLLLKMDIEGAECGILDQIVEHAARIACLVCELHDLDAQAPQFLLFARGLSASHTVVHLHGNNADDLCSDGRTPRTIEVTLVRRDLIEATAPSHAGPLPRPGLDFPCSPLRADYQLSPD